MKRKKWPLLLVAAVVLAIGIFSVWGERLEFMAGGMLINAGYRLQDRLESFDFEHHELTPNQVWEELVSQNHLSSRVRASFPRSTHHPLVAMVACMDARLDTNEIAGDTRKYYYVLRLAGSVISPKEEEMLELAVSNGTKVVVFTTHSDCAAEKASKDPAQAARFPNLIQALAERKSRIDEFVKRPAIKEKLDSGELIVKTMQIDTKTDGIAPLDVASVR